MEVIRHHVTFEWTQRDLSTDSRDAVEDTFMTPPVLELIKAEPHTAGRPSRATTEDFYLCGEKGRIPHRALSSYRRFFSVPKETKRSQRSQDTEVMSPTVAVVLGSFCLERWFPPCRKRKKTPSRMGRKRESWNNYVRLFDLLVMQEEACPRLTPSMSSVSCWLASGLVY